MEGASEASVGDSIVMAGADGSAGPDARPGWQWDVALSFVGAQRDYVDQAAQARGVRCFTTPMSRSSCGEVPG
jgi:hypothetical protein